MAEYEVRDVVCDYGVYEDSELILILNSRRIALQIVELLKEDERIHRELNPIKDYPPYLDRPKPPINDADEEDVVPRSEVAKIFEEIEYLIWQNDTHPACELTEQIAELKKKYTEEKQ